MREYNERMLELFKNEGFNTSLLDKPVISYAAPFVTVAFKSAPRASDYKAFNDACWEVYGGFGHSILEHSNTEFVEVTFKRTDFSAKTPQKM
jgi:hypothetical protein